VLGRKFPGNGWTEKWTVRLVGHGEQQSPGDYDDITSAVIESASVRLDLGLAANQNLAIATLAILTGFLRCPLQETLYMCLPDGQWPEDPNCRACRIVKLNKMLYGIKQVNREYFEEVFDFTVDHLGVQAKVVAFGLCSGGILTQPNGVLIPEYVADIIIIGSLKNNSSIASRLYDRFKGAVHVPGPDTLQYLAMTVTRNDSERSIAIIQIGYIDRIPDCPEMANSRKCSILLEVGRKPDAIQADEQPIDTGMYQKAVGSILCAALGT
jgi:hypothetical protein